MKTTTTTTTIILWPYIRYYPGELVPEDTFTHPPSWSSSKRVWKVLVYLEGMYRLGINGWKTTPDPRSAEKCPSKQRECACMLIQHYITLTSGRFAVFHISWLLESECRSKRSNVPFHRSPTLMMKDKTGRWSSLVGASSTPRFPIVLWCCLFRSRRASGPQTLVPLIPKVSLKRISGGRQPMGNQLTHIHLDNDC